MLTEFAVVRHENQTLGVVIQTPHVEDALVLVADDIAQGVTSLRVIHGAQHTLRLVQGECDMIGIHANAGTIHSNLLVLRIDSGAELGDEFTVDLDASVGDDFLAFAAGSETCLCEQLLQADTFIVVIVRLGGAGICVWHRSPNVAG